MHQDGHRPFPQFRRSTANSFQHLNHRGKSLHHECPRHDGLRAVVEADEKSIAIGDPLRHVAADQRRTLEVIVIEILDQAGEIHEIGGCRFMFRLLRMVEDSKGGRSGIEMHLVPADSVGCPAGGIEEHDVVGSGGECLLDDPAGDAYSSGRPGRYSAGLTEQLQSDGVLNIHTDSFEKLEGFIDDCTRECGVQQAHVDEYPCSSFSPVKACRATRSCHVLW